MKNLIYEGIEYTNFEIDECGNVRNKKTGHIYKNTISVSGYLHVSLPMGKRGIVKTLRVHKAVAETYIPNPNHYSIVNHIDENKQNAHVSNLEWTTSQGNTQSHLKNCSKTQRYFNNRKLTYHDAEMIREFAGYFTQRQFADMFGVSKVTIAKILSGEHYSNGY